MTTLLVILAISMALPLIGATKPNSAPFTWTDEFSEGSYGPNLYYGEDVYVEYTAINTWHVESKDNGDGTWDVNQELTQKGFAYVYASDGDELLDKRNFRVVEITLGTVDSVKSWYYILDFHYVKNWNYHWKIAGIYHFTAEGKKFDNFDIDDYWAGGTYSAWVKGSGWQQSWPHD